MNLFMSSLNAFLKNVKYFLHNFSIFKMSILRFLFFTFVCIEAFIVDKYDIFEIES